MSFHTIIIVGNLGRDPEMRYTPTKQPVTTLSVASNRRYTALDGTVKEETVWFRVAAWGKQAENCKAYLKKGDKVLIEGRLVPPGDAQALAGALLEMAADEGKRKGMARSALARASEFSWNNLVGEVEKAYAEAMERWEKRRRGRGMKERKT